MAQHIRHEIGAIALVAFALLTTVALATDQGAVLQWWRSVLFALLGWAAFLVPLALAAVALELWVGFVHRDALLPIAGAIVIVFALLGLTRRYVRDDLAGGYVGSAIANAASAAFGEIGAPIALGALALVGLVIAANRTLADLAAPLWRQRQAIGALRPGTLIPAGTAPRFTAVVRPAEDAPEQVRINIPESKPPKPVDASQSPKPSQRDGVPPASGRLPIARGPSEAESPRSATDSLAPSIAGLPSAAVAAEGVLHADPPEKPWVLPSIDLLEEGAAARSGEKEVVRNTRVIEETLANFDIAATVVEVSVGPVVTRYELKPAAGVKVSRIEALADDLALALAARTLRIEAPIPGKSVVGIEIPNMAIGLVSLRDVAESAEFKGSPSKLTVALGKDVAGAAIVTDLAKLPHLLIPRQTGSGKSVCIGSILTSLLMQSTPDEVRILIGDLKRVDFPGFNCVPHLVVPVIHDAGPILNAPYWTTSEMDRRYRLFARTGAPNIAPYNDKQAGSGPAPNTTLFSDHPPALVPPRHFTSRNT